MSITLFAEEIFWTYHRLVTYHFRLNCQLSIFISLIYPGREEILN